MLRTAVNIGAVAAPDFSCIHGNIDGYLSLDKSAITISMQLLSVCCTANLEQQIGIFFVQYI